MATNRRAEPRNQDLIKINDITTTNHKDLINFECQFSTINPGWPYPGDSLQQAVTLFLSKGYLLLEIHQESLDSFNVLRKLPKNAETKLLLKQNSLLIIKSICLMNNFLEYMHSYDVKNEVEIVVKREKNISFTKMCDATCFIILKF